MRAERGGADRPTELLLLGEKAINTRNHRLIYPVVEQGSTAKTMFYIVSICRHKSQHQENKASMRCSTNVFFCSKYQYQKDGHLSTLSVNLLDKLCFCVKTYSCAHLFLTPVPLPRFPPTRVCRDGRAERLICCLLGPLRPPGMVASYRGNHGRHPPTNSRRDSSRSPQWATM